MPSATTLSPRLWPSSMVVRTMARLLAERSRFMTKARSIFSSSTGRSDQGHAWTLACNRQFNEHWSLALEDIEVRSKVAQRTLIGEPQQANERQWQLALRYER